MIYLDKKRTRIKSELRGDGKIYHTDNLSLVDINYEKTEGIFEPIDNTIVEINDENYGLQVEKAGLKIKFSASESVPLIYHGDNSSDLSTNFKGLAILNPDTMDFDFINTLNPAPAMTYFNNTVMYMDVYPNIDLYYKHLKSRVKQEILIPEAERTALIGNSGDYLVIVSELDSEEEITLEDGVTVVGTHRIRPQVAYFNERTIGGDTPMTAWHKVVDDKTYLLVGIPIELATDIATNSGTLVLDPDTLTYPDTDPIWWRSSDVSSYAGARDVTSADSVGDSWGIGNTFSGGTYHVDRAGVIVDLSGYTDGNYVVTGVDLDAKPNTKFEDGGAPGARWIKATFSGSQTVAEFNNFTGWAASGVYSPTYWSDARTSWTTGVYNVIALTSLGIQEVEDRMNDSGTFEGMLIHTNDISNTPQVGQSLVYDITSNDVIRMVITYTQESTQTPNLVTGVSASSAHDGVTLNFTTPVVDGTHDLATSYEIWESDSTNGTYLQITGGDLSDAKASAQPHSIKVVTSGAGADEVNDSELNIMTINAPTTITASDGTYYDKVQIVLSGASVTNGTTKYYRIKAVNAGGTTAYHSPTTGVSGQRQDTIDPNGYEIWASPSTSDDSHTQLATAQTVNYNDTTRAPVSVLSGDPSVPTVTKDENGQITVTWSNAGITITPGAIRYYKAKSTGLDSDIVSDISGTSNAGNRDDTIKGSEVHASDTEAGSFVEVSSPTGEASSPYIHGDL